MSRTTHSATTEPRSASGDQGPPEESSGLPRSSWKAALRSALRQIGPDQLTDRAASLTYYGVLAMFPGMLVLVSILGMLGRSATATVRQNVEQIAPSGQVRQIIDTVIDNAQQHAGGASLAAVLGILIALWSASGYIAGFMRASNGIYGVDEGRPVYKTIPVRLGVTVVVVVMLVISAAIVVLTGGIADEVGKDIGIGHTALTAWSIAKWPVLLVIVALLLAILYWACPNVRSQRFRWVSPGSALAVMIWVVASALFAVYVANFASYDKTYGSLAGVIVFLVWLWISNLAVLLGVEFDAELDHQVAIAAGIDPAEQPFSVLRDTTKLDDAQTAQAESVRDRRELV